MSYEELLFGGGTTEQAPQPQVNPLALNFGLDSGGAEDVGGYGEPPAQRRRTEDGAAAGGAAAPAPAGPGQAKCFCNYCQRDITDRTRIKCAECLDFAPSGLAAPLSSRRAAAADRPARRGAGAEQDQVPGLAVELNADGRHHE